MTSLPSIRNPLCLVVKIGGCIKQLPTDGSDPAERDYDGTLYFNRILSHCAAIKTHARAVDQFGFADMRDEEFLRAERLGHVRSIDRRKHTHRSSSMLLAVFA